MEVDSAAKQEEDLWSEVSLSESTSPLIDDQALEEESFWGADDTAGAGELGAAPSGEDLLEEVREPEIHELTEEAPIAPPAAAVPPPPPAPTTPAAPVRPPEADLQEGQLETAVAGKIENAVRAHFGDAISETARQIIQEVAWEVIPDLAEAMIKSEIEKIKKKESGA